ncbi:hypothetical protein AaE_014610, partial [Aphanomyces astaci]
KNELKAKATAKPASVNLNVMEATPMEPNGIAQSGATMEHIKVSGSTSYCESKIGGGSCEEEGVPVNQTHFLVEFVPVQPPIIPEGPAMSREEMAALDVELNPRPFQPLDDSEALQDEIDFVEGVLDDIDLHPTLEPYPFQPLEESTAIHREVQFIEEALHDIDLGEDPPFLPQDPVQNAIQVRPPRRNPVNYVGRQSYEVFEEGGHTQLQVPGKTKTCPHCRAKLTPHDYKNLPCCLKGKVKMDPYVFPDSPEMQAFKDLFKQRNFIEHIRQYNAQFNFTSTGTNEVRHSGSGPKTYFLNRSGNLREPSFAQIYMHTSEDQLQHRRNMFPAFSSRYTATIQRVMDIHNPLARTYATAKERLRRAEADGTSGGNLQIVLKAVGGAQARTHNLPTVAQLAVIMEGDGSEPTEGRNVVLQSLNSNRFTTIRETNPLHDALQFPLMFPMGGPGWEYTMTKTDGKSLSLRAFFNYWLQERDGDDFSD